MHDLSLSQVKHYEAQSPQFKVLFYEKYPTLQSQVGNTKDLCSPLLHLVQLVLFVSHSAHSLEQTLQFPSASE